MNAPRLAPEHLQGSWALVTGASSGIGAEFCVQLARAGANVVLVARRRARLEAVAADAMRAGRIQTLIVEQDLQAPAAAESIRGALAGKGIRIRLLVNNAAFGHWGRFEAKPAPLHESMLRVNAQAVVGLCHAFLPDLTETAPSAVINVASQAAYQPVPFMATYAATKAFVLSFSQALHAEWAERGILVQALVPGPTATEFDTVASATAVPVKARWPAGEAVSAALNGLRSGQPVVVSARGTYKQRLFAGLFPPRIVIREVARMFRPPGVR